MKKLRIWNGRWERNQHAYVCAYSRADARRVIKECTGRDPGDTELKDYWSECWGNSMEGVERERGLWISSRSFGSDKPERVTQRS